MAIYRKIRRSQYIFPSGVGALYDISDESMIAMDISKWKPNYGEKLNLKRLEQLLRVNHFKMPESHSDMGNKKYSTAKDKLPFLRFPQWLFCRSCGTMVKWTMQKDIDNKAAVPKCENFKCQKKPNLTPMRYVMACDKGHVSDIDWHYWAHSSSNSGCKVKNKLKYKSLRKSGGPALPTVICEECGSSRDLAYITSKDIGLGQIGIHCMGIQPWERWPENPKCDGEIRAVQRSASNLYYPKLISALDIPFGQDNPGKTNELEHEIKSNNLYNLILKKLHNSEGNEAALEAFADEIAKKANCSIEEVLRIANEEVGNNKTEEFSDQIVINEEEILFEEWKVLTNPTKNTNKNFEAKEEFIGDIEFGFKEVIDKLVLVKKLREVTALRGFHRIRPSQEEFVPVDLGNNINWLPATEVFGEGIFLSINEKAIDSWSKKNEDAIKKRLQSIQKKYEQMELDFLPEPTPKFVLLHTLAHLLIRQLSFECGYAASSLRERIYASENDSPMSGILIYTADSDAEGSMGGLVRQGNKDRLIPTLITALERGQWCSADPVCSELAGQGINGLNRAACHSCTLLSETSCVSHNSLLDRMLLLGNDEKNHNYGFFSQIIEQLTKAL